MKKQFLLVLMFGAFLGSPLIAQDASLEECKDSIYYNGPVITVTVCDRSTSVAGAAAGLKCDAEGSSTCSFTNY